MSAKPSIERLSRRPEEGMLSWVWPTSVVRIENATTEVELPGSWISAGAWIGLILPFHYEPDIASP